MITKAEPWGSAFVLSAALRHFERSEAESRNLPAKVSCRDEYQWCRVGEGTLRKQFPAGKEHR